MRHAPWKDGELAHVLGRFPFFGASGEKLEVMQVQRCCRVLRGWMARAESPAVLRVPEDMEDTAGVEGMIDGTGVTSQYLPGSSGVFAFPLPGSWSFDSCSFSRFLGREKNCCLVLLFLFYVGRGEWAREKGNWSQGENLCLCLSVLGVTALRMALDSPGRAKPPILGASALPLDTAGVNSGNLMGLPLGKGCEL